VGIIAGVGPLMLVTVFAPCPCHYLSTGRAVTAWSIRDFKMRLRISWCAGLFLAAANLPGEIVNIPVTLTLGDGLGHGLENGRLHVSVAKPSETQGFAVAML
jgi:hypothetical protein